MKLFYFALILIVAYLEMARTVSVSIDSDDGFSNFKIEYSKTYETREEEYFRMMIFIENRAKNEIGHKHADKLSHELVESDFHQYGKEFQDFKKIFNKTYTSKDDLRFRQKIFIENKRAIDNHNKLFIEGLVTYGMSVNQFTDMLFHEISSTFLGAKRPDRKQRKSQYTFVPPSNFSYSDEFDWRSKGAVTPVKSQGQCGSCWSFAATGALEGQHFQKTKKLVSLSEQNLVDCATSATYGCNGCNGGRTDMAFAYIKDNGGIDSESSYPYNAHQGQCQFDKSHVEATDSGYVVLTPNSELELLKAVSSIGPIAVYITVTNSLISYKTGVYYEPSCDPNTLNHAVLAVGYGTEAGQDYWLIKNSWSELWGDKGYIKMARNKNNNCGIGAFSVYPKV